MKNKLSRILCTALCCAPLLATAQTSENITSPQRLYQEGQSLFQQKAYAAAIPPLQAFVRQIDAEGKPLPVAGERMEAEYMLVCAAYELKDLKSLDKLQAYLDLFFIFFYKAIHPFGSLPLSLCQWRCNKCHIPVSQIQQMSCHKSAHYGIILINGIYSSSFLFVTDNNKRNCLCHCLYLQLKIRIWVAAVDNSLGLQCLHHPQIFFLQPGVSLGITDKNSIPLFIRHCLNPL